MQNSKLVAANCLGEGHVFSTPAAGEGVTGLSSFHFRMGRHLFSGRNSDFVPVDCVLLKHVHRPLLILMLLASTLSLVP